LKNALLLSTFFAVCAIAATSSAQVDPNRVIATVNGEEIRGGEYYRRMEFLPGVGRQLGNQFAEAPPGFLTIQRIIDERLLLQLAKEKNVMPTAAEIQAEIKVKSEENAKLLEQLATMGMTQADLEYQVRLELAQFKLQTQGITITDLELEDFYKKNPTMFIIPKRYKLRVLALTEESKKAEVDKDLAGGMAFADVAKKHSQDLSKGTGGDIGYRPVASLDENVRSVVEATKIGQATPWIANNGAHVRFFVEDIQAESKQPLDARTRRNLRRRLMVDRSIGRNNVMQDLNNMRTKAKIDIKNPEFARIYRQFSGLGG